MVNTNTLTAVIAGVVIVIALWVIHRLYSAFKLYHFFNNYVGYVHTHHITKYKYAKRLYRRLFIIRKSVNGDDLFDVALITHSRRSSDIDIYEKTKAMLNVIEPKYYKNSELKFYYTESDVQRYCFNLIGSSNKPDMIRLLLWIIIINPTGVRSLKELQ